MSLQVWLPLCGNTNNQGLANVSVTNTGATTNSAGKIGSCYSFTTSKLIQCVLATSITSINNSVACWVKFNSFPASGAYVCLLKAGGVGSGYSTGTIMLWLEGSQMYVTVKGASPVAADKVSYSFTTGTWYHLTATYDGSIAKIYSNGIEIYSKSVVSTGTYTTITSFLVGANNAGTTSSPSPNYGLNGYINDARFYDHCLSQAEIYEIAKGKMIHLKLDNGGFGQENLAIGSQGVWVSNLGSADGSRAEFCAKSLGQAFPVTSGTKVRLSFDLHMEVKTARTASEMKLLVYNTNYKGPHYAWIYKEVLAGRALAAGDVIDEHFSFTGTVNDKSDSTLLVDWIEFYSVYGTSNWYSISNLHIELGEVETPWAPHSTDAFYISSQLGTQFDCSGYRHDAITNVITHSSDTARYVCSSVFNGSSSYVKVNDNTWMADGLTEFTVSIWMKASSWPSQIRPFCCLETGGFGLGNAGDSGYYRFYVREYQNTAHSTTGYDSNTQALKISNLSTTDWNHIAIVYTTSGTKTYLNGELHHNYTRTSYGIHFNTGARLFLGCEANAANPASPWFGGQLSDFRLYATALSEEDIKILYHTSGFVDNQGNVFAGELREV